MYDVSGMNTYHSAVKKKKTYVLLESNAASAVDLLCECLMRVPTVHILPYAVQLDMLK